MKTALVLMLPSSIILEGEVIALQQNAVEDGELIRELRALTPPPKRIRVDTELIKGIIIEAQHVPHGEPDQKEKDDQFCQEVRECFERRNYKFSLSEP